MENCPERQVLNKVPVNNIFPDGTARWPVVAVSVIMEQEDTEVTLTCPHCPHMLANRSDTSVNFRQEWPRPKRLARQAWEEDVQC